ncbi:hypothetical protein Mycch_1652 [Mycolicibacterium chubuense NBB4]|uniref:Uncharacterized protein n=1 Tax=Mycolicibacterium chubuense (strain NBB4) TaxID=710421 RepID=I4BGN9_MYCCN|nr:hypothetical protein Mycch_1652 [Mycolicibacterium chubuense NBB4]
MCQDIGDISSLLGALTVLPLPTYLTPAAGCVLDEDFAVEVGHGDAVVVNAAKTCSQASRPSTLWRTPPSKNVPAVFRVKAQVPSGKSWAPAQADVALPRRGRIGVGQAWGEERRLSWWLPMPCVV